MLSPAFSSRNFSSAIWRWGWLEESSHRQIAHVIHGSEEGTHVQALAAANTSPALLSLGISTHLRAAVLTGVQLLIMCTTPRPEEEAATRWAKGDRAQIRYALGTLMSLQGTGAGQQSCC